MKGYETIYMVALTALVIASPGYAACVNNCNHRGECTDDGLCVCWPGFTNGDCGQRECPFWRSWGKDAADPHWYEECSGKGVCDRDRAECQCEPGFTGHACQRKKCHNDCSGHGRCSSLSCLPNVAASEAGWEADRIYTCSCDPGFFGSDCSKRMCPTGDDPRTHCTTFVNDDGDIVHQHDKNFVSQVIEYTIPIEVVGPDKTNPYPLTTGGSPSLSSLIKLDAELPPVYDERLFLRFNDSLGQEWDFPPVEGIINPVGDFDTDLKSSLESLPSFAVNEVSVQVTENWFPSFDATNPASATPTVKLRVDYVPDTKNGLLVGNKNLLQCVVPFACSQPGCKPRVKIPFAVRYVSTGVIPLHTFNVTDASTPIDAAPLNRNGNVQDHWDNNRVILLHSDSDPGLPEGEGWTTNPEGEFDVRIALLLLDKEDNEDGVDSWYAHVGGNNNGDNSLAIDKSPNGQMEPGDVASPLLPDIGESATRVPPGYTFMGNIPTSGNAYGRLPVPGLPGVWVRLPSENMVGDGQARIFEIMYKLPQCSTDHVSQDPENSETVSRHIENAECSQRGLCDYATGKCECFAGFSGLSCSEQDVLG